MAQKLSDEARQHKNEYNAEYVKQTKGAAQRKWNEENKERKKQNLSFCGCRKTRIFLTIWMLLIMFPAI